MKRAGLNLLKLIGILIFIWIIANIDRGKLIETLKSADIKYIAASLAALAIIICTKTIRWHILVRAGGLKSRVSESWRLFYIGFFLANITPAKLGEFGRAAYLMQRGMKGITAIAVTIVDRLADAVITGVLAILGILYLFGFETFMYTTLISAAGLLIIFAVIRKIFLIKTFNSIYPLIRGMFKPIVIHNALMATIAHWIAYFIWAILLARSVGVFTPPAALSSVLILAGIIATLPIAPSGLGTRDAALIAMLAPFGVPAEQAIALAFLMFTSIILSSMPGAWYWWRGMPDKKQIPLSQ